MKIDDEIIVCSNGECYISKLTALQGSTVNYEVIKKMANISFPEITLFQGMPKYAKVDTVIKYATIFGASKIVFTQMQRSEAKIKQIESKTLRLNRISKEAAELAHKFDYPLISFLKGVDQIDFSQFDLVIFADEISKDSKINYPFNNLSSKSKIAIIIGPEGGITDYERNLLISNNSYQVSLGPFILPTEIASLYLISVISSKYLKMA